MEIHLECKDEIMRQHELGLKTEYAKLLATRLEEKSWDEKKKHKDQIKAKRDEILAHIGEDRTLNRT